MSKVLDVVRKNQTSLLEEWMKGIKTGIRRNDLIDERDLKSQASDVLSNICIAPNDAPLDNLNSPDWQPLKDLLASISASRAVQGFTPSETALFVLSLKAPVFNLIRELKESADQMFADIGVINNFVDKLALTHYRQLHSWTRSGNCPATGRDAGTFDSGSHALGRNRRASADRNAGQCADTGCDGVVASGHRSDQLPLCHHRHYRRTNRRYAGCAAFAENHHRRATDGCRVHFERHSAANCSNYRPSRHQSRRCDHQSKAFRRFQARVGTKWPHSDAGCQGQRFPTVHRSGSK